MKRDKEVTLKTESTINFSTFVSVLVPWPPSALINVYTQYPVPSLAVVSRTKVSYVSTTRMSSLLSSTSIVPGSNPTPYRPHAKFPYRSKPTKFGKFDSLNVRSNNKGSELSMQDDAG